jgi:hypothetical protein
MPAVDLDHRDFVEAMLADPSMPTRRGAACRFTTSGQRATPDDGDHHAVGGNGIFTL